MRALAVCILLAMPLTSLPGQTDATTLSALRDQARPLLIFAGPNDSRVEQQYAELATHAVEARDRDIRVALLTTSHTRMHDDSRPPEASFSAGEQQHLRQRFHVKPDEFAVILVGKDGGEKLRSDKPVLWEKLASKIDGMPMRRDEVRGR